MDLKQIEALAQLMEEKSLTGLEVWEGENKIVLARGACAQAAPVYTPVTAAQIPAAEAVPSGAPAGNAGATGDEDQLKSPLVGTVYLAPSPDADAFVAVGSQVKKGQTLCIVEAMKVMNEFTAPKNGVITEICVENGQLVEHGQPLFRLQ